MEEVPGSTTDADAACPPQVIAKPRLVGSAASRPRLSPGNAASLQRAIGNAAIARLVDEASEAGLRSTLPEAIVELGPDVGLEASPDGGPLPVSEAEEAVPATEGGESVAAADARDKAGEGVFFGATQAPSPGVEAAPTLDDAPKNEFGEIDGELPPWVARLFISGDRANEGIVYWAGGPGGETHRKIELLGPHYKGVDADGVNPARAWILPGTGTVTVTKSFFGVLLGANGSYYFTARARARVDAHERMHIASGRAEHDRHIAPLERRVAQHTGEDNARAAGGTADEAIASLETFIDWNASIERFHTADRTQNAPGGAVDTADFRSADFVRDYGARIVQGVRYEHYIDLPPGPAPPPPARRGGGAGRSGGSPR